MTDKKENTNLLTLIYGDEVHLPPEKKVIDGTLFSKLIEGSEMLEKIKVESKQYRIDVSKECEEIKEKAYQVGFQEGFEAWTEQVAALETQIENVRNELEKIIVPVALKAAKKIVGREMELNKETVVDIVHHHLKAVAQHKKVTLWVSKEDYNILEKKKNILKEQFEELEAFSVRPRDDITEGGCVIETEMGIINAQVENQWAILERAFERMTLKEDAKA